MILDISDAEFRNIMDDKELALPRRWGGRDFYGELHKLFDYYIDVLKQNNIYHYYCNNISLPLSEIKSVCGNILRAVEHYFNGFPDKAYNAFAKVMKILMGKPLKVYQKSITEQFEGYRANYGYKDKLNLFRAVRVDENIPYGRARVFHTPYSLRSKVSTSRYSIAGFPSLYLGTSLNLCCEEIGLDIDKDLSIAALFKLERYFAQTEINIRVIELGIKPQDFVERNNREDYPHRRILPEHLLRETQTKAAYLLWYPLIAACSYIRANKKDPFAAEYVIPQLLMQWVRQETAGPRGAGGQLMGIRYFSCASERSSEDGFNYVFPSATACAEAKGEFCTILSKAFKLTRPVFIHEFYGVAACERALLNMEHELDFVNR